MATSLYIFIGNHLPWDNPEQPPGHTGTVQWSPPHPSSQLQTSATTQRPWPLQSAQRTTSHAAPEKPSSHVQTEVSPSQAPWPEQLRGQTAAVGHATTQPRGGFCHR